MNWAAWVRIKPKDIVLIGKTGQLRCKSILETSCQYCMMMVQTVSEAVIYWAIILPLHWPVYGVSTRKCHHRCHSIQKAAVSYAGVIPCGVVLSMHAFVKCTHVRHSRSIQNLHVICMSRSVCTHAHLIMMLVPANYHHTVDPPGTCHLPSCSAYAQQRVSLGQFEPQHVPRPS